MNLLPDSLSRRFTILAPQGVNLTPFVDVAGNPDLHKKALAAIQRFRGSVYLAEGNLNKSNLTDDGRHVQPADDKSWHLFTLDERGEVGACGRILVHDEDVSFSDLTLSHSALATSIAWGQRLREAVEAEILAARRSQKKFIELGAWAVGADLRCTAEAVRIVLAGYALTQLMGGMAGISTVNTQHGSSSILRRIGGRPLTTEGSELPRFYEPMYRAKLEILKFNSSEPNPRYASHIEMCRMSLPLVSVIAADKVTNPWVSSLQQLQIATNRLSVNNTQFSPAFAH